MLFMFFEKSSVRIKNQIKQNQTVAKPHEKLPEAAASKNNSKVVYGKGFKDQKKAFHCVLYVLLDSNIGFYF